MTTIAENSSGIKYLHGVLKEKPLTTTKVALWNIPHKNPDSKDVCLKLGRYHKKKNSAPEVPESMQPKSELTLDSEELLSLITFLSDNYEPFRKGIKQYISISKNFDETGIQELRDLFENPDKQQLLSFIMKNNIFPKDFSIALQHQEKACAINKFKEMLGLDLVEQDWQKWFAQNSWVLGSEFVQVLDERVIDTRHISDYLMQAYDGFLDIVEIKRPGGGLSFWSDTKDHQNYYPSSALTKAIAQATKYIFEIEQEANSIKFLERVGHIKTIKPRCVLIFGRSDDWNEEQKKAYRILNSSYHNLSIMTYDHALKRAEQILSIVPSEVEAQPQSVKDVILDVPF